MTTKIAIITAISLASLLNSSYINKANATIPFFEQFSENDNVPSLAPVIEKVTPAVVNISTKTKVKLSNNQNPLFEDPFFRQFFDYNTPKKQREQEVMNVGSGVIIDDKDGYIITNNHLIRDASEVYVTLKDKRRLKAEIIGADEETDIAVLKIRGDNLTALKIGDSSKLQVGDFVVAIGNPFGLGQTVTSGMVSALGRNGLGIEGYENFIQTDAAINPGNSGGALIDLKGQLIGINTAILSKSGGSVGIGFAIPMSMVNEVMPQLIKYGAVERGYMGLNIQDITTEISEALGISTSQGALIAKVEKGSAADIAGIKAGDIVIKLNDEPIIGANDLKNKVGMLKIGHKVTLEIIHEGKNKKTNVIVGKKLNTNEKTTITSTIPLLKGAQLSVAPSAAKTEGVLVVRIEADSPAAIAGLQQGDIITAVNQKKVTNPAQIVAASKKNARALLLNVQRGGTAIFIAVQ